MLSIIKGAIIPEAIKDETLPELLQPSFLKFADKTALIFGKDSITYSIMDSWSNFIAKYLIDLGVKPGDTVGVWYPRSMELPVIILGILKAGAAYVPLDSDMPLERIQKVFTDIQVKTYFSDRDAQIHCSPIQPPQYNRQPFPASPVQNSPDNWAYVLFTSGSTGNPKGIPISHRNICHLIRAEQHTIQIRPEDTVYQGFSVTFDMWCEEVWISMFAGATIWVADAVTVKALDELGEVWKKNGITVLHAVPSVLALVDEIPSIRFVNSGGEACTRAVIDKWGTPERVFINSYGPTETTVSSNMSFCKKGDEITIGPPLPNYHLAVVDENMNIVPRGEQGEMVIVSPGVAQGYFNLPELTKQKFLKNPFPEQLPGEHLYKTGDSVIIREDGFIEFHGRIDDQVKLRGFRIELGEIESRLAAIEGVTTSAVAIRKDGNEQEQLVGYVVWNKNKESFNEENIRKQLAKFLAPYMVPVVIVQINEMPRMPSGKINRKILPVPEIFLTSGGSEQKELHIAATDSVSEKVIKVLSFVFKGKEINQTKDFFTDLSGHSLLAAITVSHLRKDAQMPFASLKDIYEHRPISAFIETLEQKEKTHQSQKVQEPFYIAPDWHYYLCNFAQTLCLILIYGLLAIEIIIPYLGYYYFLVEGYSHLMAILAATSLYIIVPIFLTFFSLVLKWGIVGRLKEGNYPLWGRTYFKWWLWKTFRRLLPSQYIIDTPLFPRYLRLLGVKVHGSAQLSGLSIGAEDLVIIGKNVSTSSGCVIDNAGVENGMLKLRKVLIGDNAYLGTSSVVCGDTVIEENGVLQDLGCLKPGDRIGRNEIWDGSPATKIKIVEDNDLPKINLASNSKRNLHALKYLASQLIFPLVAVLPLTPTLYVLYVLDENADWYDFTYLWQTPFLSMSYLIVFILFISLLSRILQYKMKEGDYSIYSFTYYRKWMKDQLMNLSLIVLHPLYASVYISIYYKMLGAKVGKNSEISTASDVSHNLLEIGNGSFIADAVILGEHDVRNETLYLKRTKIGNNSFVGNSGVIPQGYHLSDNTLIGVLSKAPEEQKLKDNPKMDWFGSPPIALPSRQHWEGFDNSRTYNPPLNLKIYRAIVEGLRIILPQTFVICTAVLLVAYAHNLLENSIGKLLLYIPFYYLFFMGIPLFLITVILKWIFVGVYKKAAYPMYSLKVWISEAITGFHETLSVPFLLDPLRGTMWLPIAMRLMGVKIGKRTWLNTTDITEFDMVSIGDHTVLNEDCGPQTHLFEDRIMKIGSVDFGKNCTVGSRSIVLYDSVIEDNVNIASLSLVMKGEHLPTNTSWAGSPTMPQ